MRTKSKAVTNLRKDLSIFSDNLRNLQLVISDASYALKHHMIVSMKDLNVVERGLANLDTLRMQLISLSNVGHKTCERLERDEALIQSLRAMKTTLGVESANMDSVSTAYIKSRNQVLSLLRQSLEDYMDEEGIEDLDINDLDRSPTERLMDFLISFPMGLVSAYCQFFYDIKARVDTKSKKTGRGGRKVSYQSDIDKDLEVMESLYNLSEAYKDVLLKRLTSVEELMGIIKGVHLSLLQFDIPIIENLSMLSLSALLGTALAIKELEGNY